MINNNNNNEKMSEINTKIELWTFIHKNCKIEFVPRNNHKSRGYVEIYMEKNKFETFIDCLCEYQKICSHYIQKERESKNPFLNQKHSYSSSLSSSYYDRSPRTSSVKRNQKSLMESEKEKHKAKGKISKFLESLEDDSILRETIDKKISQLKNGNENGNTLSQTLDRFPSSSSSSSIQNEQTSNLEFKKPNILYGFKKNSSKSILKEEKNNVNTIFSSSSSSSSSSNQNDSVLNAIYKTYEMHGTTIPNPFLIDETEINRN